MHVVCAWGMLVSVCSDSTGSRQGDTDFACASSLSHGIQMRAYIYAAVHIERLVGESSGHRIAPRVCSDYIFARSREGIVRYIACGLSQSRARLRRFRIDLQLQERVSMPQRRVQ